MPRYRVYRKYKDKKGKTYMIIDGNKVYIDKKKFVVKKTKRQRKKSTAIRRPRVDSSNLMQGILRETQQNSTMQSLIEQTQKVTQTVIQQLQRQIEQNTSSQRSQQYKKTSTTSKNEKGDQVVTELYESEENFNKKLTEIINETTQKQKELENYKSQLQKTENALTETSKQLQETGKKLYNTTKDYEVKESNYKDLTQKLRTELETLDKKYKIKVQNEGNIMKIKEDMTNKTKEYEDLTSKQQKEIDELTKQVKELQNEYEMKQKERNNMIQQQTQLKEKVQTDLKDLLESIQNAKESTISEKIKANEQILFNKKKELADNFSKTMQIEGKKIINAYNQSKKLDEESEEGDIKQYMNDNKKKIIWNDKQGNKYEFQQGFNNYYEFTPVSQVNNEKLQFLRDLQEKTRGGLVTSEKSTHKSFKLLVNNYEKLNKNIQEQFEQYEQQQENQMEKIKQDFQVILDQTFEVQKKQQQAEEIKKKYDQVINEKGEVENQLKNEQVAFQNQAKQLIDIMTEKNNEIQQQKKTIEELTKVKIAKLEVDNTLEQLKKQINTKEIKEVINDLANKLVDEENVNLKTQLQKIQEKEKTTQQTIFSLESQIEEKNSLIETKTNEIVQKKNTIDTINEELVSLKKKSSSDIEEVKGWLAKYELLDAEKKKVDEQLKIEKQTIEQIRTEVNNLKKQHNEELNKKQQEYNQVSNLLSETSGKLLDTENKLQEKIDQLQKPKKKEKKIVQEEEQKITDISTRSEDLSRTKVDPQQILNILNPQQKEKKKQTTQEINDNEVLNFIAFFDPPKTGGMYKGLTTSDVKKQISDVKDAFKNKFNQSQTLEEKQKHIKDFVSILKNQTWYEKAKEQQKGESKNFADKLDEFSKKYVGTEKEALGDLDKIDDQYGMRGPVEDQAFNKKLERMIKEKKVLSHDDLNELADDLHIKNFMGVFTNFENLKIPKNRDKEFCFIINYQFKKDQPGHYVAFYFSLDQKNKVFFFDSQNNKEIKVWALKMIDRILRQQGHHFMPVVVMNKKIDQPPQSFMCGYYAINFIDKIYDEKVKEAYQIGLGRSANEGASEKNDNILLSRYKKFLLA